MDGNVVRWEVPWEQSWSTKGFRVGGWEWGEGGIPLMGRERKNKVWGAVHKRGIEMDGAWSGWLRIVGDMSEDRITGSHSWRMDACDPRAKGNLLKDLSGCLHSREATAQAREGHWPRTDNGRAGGISAVQTRRQGSEQDTRIGQGNEEWVGAPHRGRWGRTERCGGQREAESQMTWDLTPRWSWVASFTETWCLGWREFDLEGSKG